MALAAAVGTVASACGKQEPAADAWWREVAAAAGDARGRRATEVAGRFSGRVGEAFTDARRAAGEFASSEAGVAAAVAVLDAVGSARPDPSIVRLADPASKWPAPVRAAALRALARLTEPSAARILEDKVSPLDASDEGYAAAWIELAEALPGAASERARHSMRQALIAMGARRREEGQEDAARRLDGLARRLENTNGNRNAEGGTEALSPSEGWARLEKARDEADETEGPEGAARLRAVEEEAKRAVERWTAGGIEGSRADRLAIARAAELAGNGAVLRRALATFATSPTDRSDEARVATTWLVTLDLADRDPVAALSRVDRLARDFGGTGLDRGGRELPVAVLGAAVAESAADEARARVEGPAPDREAAGRVLAAARGALSLADADEEAKERVASAAAYVELFAAPEAGVRTLAPFLQPRSAPRVVAFMDHFQSLEPVLPSVLKRWAKGLDVEVVGILSGAVRMGMRRTPASPREERAAIAARAKELGLPLAGMVGIGTEDPAPRWLGGRGAFVFLFSPEGRLVASASGPALDPRVLDPVVQTLSRDPAATAPPR